ncbi:MAG: arginine deiminase family protein [Prolixibacteraceae bacterium]|nr:arginine deiminase family protein [Prolixibacteraceae bacterium]MDD4755378.1 arginine deiminase family protein [Prolixibacteraceae bacterium]
MQVSINSEIGRLEGVIIHTPGSEVENMTPENAERALYSDILNLSIAAAEYAQFAGVLNKFTRVFEIKKMLSGILEKQEIKNALLKEICQYEGIPGMEYKLAEYTSSQLSGLLIEGIILERNNLTDYLSKEKFMLRPLHNLFFTRDPAMGINGNMIIGRMAKRVRVRETIIIEAILRHSDIFETNILKPSQPEEEITFDQRSTIEGGDCLVIRDNVYVIGSSVRTSPQGIDFIIENLKKYRGVYHIIVQELPQTPESFIHLDMVFTCLNTDSCLVYEPIIYRLNPYRTIYIKIDNGKVKIEEQPNIPHALKKTGIDLKPVTCGGKKDLWTQEREQWHSGVNFLALSPGKVIGYERNIHTLEELHKNGFEIIRASDILSGKASIDDHQKCVITIAGSELARGGGGPRCMSMPLRRTEVQW